MTESTVHFGLETRPECLFSSFEMDEPLLCGLCELTEGTGDLATRFGFPADGISALVSNSYVRFSDDILDSSDFSADF